jgi:hypothetical protein
MHQGFGSEGFDQEDPEQNSNNQKPNPSEMHSSFKVKKGAVWQNRGGRSSMINSKGEILEWDKLHGEVEKYNPKLPKIKNRHLGGFDPKTGKLRSGSIDPGRIPNRGWNIQNKPISPSIKSVISPKSFIMDVIFGGPIMQQQLEMLNGNYYNQQPTGM